MIGEVLGGYLIERKLGEGGMGEVFLATHRRISRRAAVKVLQPEFCRDPGILTRFFNEARATSMIEHPNIVQVHDCDLHTNGRAFIIMEYLRGETLASALDRVGSLNNDLGSLFALMGQIASAVEAAHAKGIVHRDLKPDNIFLLKPPLGRGAPVVKILDFGIAKLASAAGESQSKTRTGSLLGTPLYMSPEQCRGAPQVDHRADIYSLGCVLFEMLCGRPPFQRDGAGDLIVAHVTETPPSMSSVGADVPPELEDLTRRMLEKLPSQRPTSMAEVAATLEAIAGRLAPREPRLTVIEPLEQPLGEPTPGNAFQLPPGVVATPAAVTPISGVAGGTALLPNKSEPGSSAGSSDRSSNARRAARPVEPLPLTSGETTLGGSSGQVDARPGRLRPATTMRTNPGPRVPAAVWVAGTILVVGGVAAFFLWPGDDGRHFRRGHDAVPTAETRTTATPSPNEIAPPVAVPAPPPPDLPARVTIDVQGAPDQMTATVDGETAALPLTFTRDGRTHEVIFRAPGRHDVRKVIEANRDQSLILAMDLAEHEAAPSPRRHHDRHDGDREPRARAGGARPSAAAGSATATATDHSATPEATQPKPAATTPARRLPAAITDID